MSCCGGKCGCGASCGCGSSCKGCNMYPEMDTKEFLVSGSNKEFMEDYVTESGNVPEGGEAPKACKCNPCTCNPCNCK